MADASGSWNPLIETRAACSSLLMSATVKAISPVLRSKLRSKTSCGVVPEKNTIEPYGEQMVKAGAPGINPHPSWPQP
ncbi:hypothetical protein, partial [Mesorhizobium sp.]|uniref:hypothetical protein n=1 Tax=Mesorhizobium sp. TaxID=1871066 RepID=UPI00257B214C